MLEKTDYSIIDIEITTNQNNEPKIIEIGAININPSHPDSQQKFHSLINPECPIKYIDFKVTGLRDKDLINGKRISEVFPEFIRFIDKRILVAHNAKFDLRVLRQVALSLNQNFVEPQHIDTLALAKKLLNMKSYKLGDIKKELDLDKSNHRALEDCEITHALFLKLLSEMKGKGITSLNQLNNFLKLDCLCSSNQKTLF